MSAVLWRSGALGKGTLFRYPPARVPTALIRLFRYSNQLVDSGDSTLYHLAACHSINPNDIADVVDTVVHCFCFACGIFVPCYMIEASTGQTIFLTYY